MKKLEELLTKDVVAINVTGIETAEQAIVYGGKLLVDARKVDYAYIDEMIKGYHEIGPYMVIVPGVAMPHARPGNYVKETCLSFVKLKHPIEFHHPINDPVSIIITLGGTSDNGHIELLKELGSLLADESMIYKLPAVNTYQELMNLVKREG